MSQLYGKGIDKDTLWLTLFHTVFEQFGYGFQDIWNLSSESI